MAVILAISLWSANGGLKAMFDALNVVYRVKETRSFIKLNAISLAFTFGSILFLIVAIGVLTILPAALEFIGLSAPFEQLLKIGRWPLLLLAVSLAIAVLYRFGPNRDQPRWRWLTPGGAFAAVAWLTASFLFSWYTENFGNYK